MKKLVLLAIFTIIAPALNGAAFNDSRPTAQSEPISINNYNQLRGKNAYAILGLTPNATDNDIKKRYRSLALELHPDRNPESKSAAEAAFKILGTAYSKIEGPGQTRTEEIIKFLNKDATIDEPVRQRTGGAQCQEFVYPKEQALFDLLLASFSDEFSADKINKLIQDGVNVNATFGQTKSTPLMLASKSGKIETVKLLLAAGAIVDAKTNAGETALFLAAKEGQAAVLELLLAAGANAINDTTDEYINMTPLAAAAFNNQLKAAQILLANGANVDAAKKNGETILIGLIDNNFAKKIPESSYLNMMELLLAAGANVNAMTNDGETALMKAIKRNQQEAAKVLLSHGADVNITTRKGATALSIAQSNEEFFKFMKDIDKQKSIQEIIALSRNAEAQTVAHVLPPIDEEDLFPSDEDSHAVHSFEGSQVTRDAERVAIAEENKAMRKAGLRRLNPSDLQIDPETGLRWYPDAPKRIIEAKEPAEKK